MSDAEIPPPAVALAFTNHGVFMRPLVESAGTTARLAPELAMLAELMVFAAAKHPDEAFVHADIEIGLRELDIPLSERVLRRHLDTAVEIGWLENIKEGRKVSWRLSSGMTVEEKRPYLKQSLPTANPRNVEPVTPAAEAVDAINLERLLKPSEVAQYFRVNPKTISRWARSGKLPASKTLGGHRRYRAGDVLKALNDMSNEE